jgi:hypothetical protein
MLSRINKKRGEATCSAAVTDQETAQSKTATHSSQKPAPAEKTSQPARMLSRNCALQVLVVFGFIYCMLDLMARKPEPATTARNMTSPQTPSTSVRTAEKGNKNDAVIPSNRQLHERSLLKEIHMDGHTEPDYFGRVPKATIAYTVMYSKCPSDRYNYDYTLAEQWYLDAPAVIKHSVHMNSIRNPDSPSQYDYEMFAFVDPVLTYECGQMPAILEQLGYTVQIRRAPVKREDIENQEYAKIIKDSGCCGHKEFSKLYAYTLEDYPVAVVLDTDTAILKPLDHMFDVLLQPANSTKKIPFAEYEKDYEVSHPVNAFFTRDYQTNYDRRPPHRVQAQGGYLVLRPDRQVFREYCDIIRKGDFQVGRGWGEEGFGGPNAGGGGSDRFQGIVSYYYDGVRPNTGIEVNHCTHHSNAGMCELIPGEGSAVTGKPDEECIPCYQTPLEEVTSVHISVSKPWQCGHKGVDVSRISPKHQPRVPRMFEYIEIWHKIRLDLETKLGIQTPTEELTKNDRLFGHCTKDDPSMNSRFGFEYVPMIKFGWDITRHRITEFDVIKEE